MASLKLDYCSHAAALYAVQHWHYSRSMPVGKTVRVGVWEDGVFIGCVVFARGAAMNLGKPYGLEQTEICELARVALTKHKAPVSRILAIAVKMVRKVFGVRLIVSFADRDQDHHGGIYQACGWVYTGETGQHWMFKNKKGEILHPRQVSVDGTRPEFGVVKRVDRISDCVRVRAKGKHRYLFPLCPEVAARLKPLPYPKRVRSEPATRLSSQTEEGGAAPTRTLSNV